MLITCVVSACLWIALFKVKVSSLNAEALFVQDLYAYKTPLAKKTASPKIVLVGGSGTLFSLRAASISKRTEMPVFNYGTHAGVGLRYMVHKCREVIWEGDIVVLIPEYQLYFDSSVPSETMIAYTQASDPEYFNQISLRDKLSTAFSMSMVDMGRGIVKKIVSHNGKDAPPGSAYTMDALNSFGDETLNKRAERSEINTGKVKSFGPQFCLLDQPNEYSLGVIAEFANWCKIHHVKLFAAYSSTIGFPEYKSISYKLSLQKIKEFYQRIGVPVLGNPEDFFFPVDLFLDSPYHGTDILAESASAKLSDLLQPYIGFKSQTN